MNTAKSFLGLKAYLAFIDSWVSTTLNRTIIPVPVPSTSPELFPYEISNQTC